jgi:uncharacterized protein involved in exopolysaccharide biosynthesis
MAELFRDLVRYVDRMRPEGWVLVLVAVIVVGALCLRGFGSRGNY